MTRFYRPTNLAEAVTVLADPDLGAVPIAGCTDLLVVDTATGRRHPAVVDLLHLPELRGIRRDGDLVDVGAAATFAELRRDPLVAAHLPILAEAAATIGGWQIQNRATIGGNVVNASPIGDSLPVLLALGAELVFDGPSGERLLPYEAMHTGYRLTALQPGELLVRVRIPIPEAGTVQRYKKVGTREAQAISKVVVAFTARREDARIQRVRFGAGGVAATPIRLTAAEAACEGRSANENTASSAGRAAAGEVTTIDDVRSTARYRSFVLERVVRRMVLEAGSNRPAEG